MGAVQMAVKRSKPTPSDDALSRAAKDKGVKAEAKPKPKSGFSLGFGSKAKPKVSGVVGIVEGVLGTSPCDSRA